MYDKIHYKLKKKKNVFSFTNTAENTGFKHTGEKMWSENAQFILQGKLNIIPKIQQDFKLKPWCFNLPYSSLSSHERWGHQWQGLLLFYDHSIFDFNITLTKMAGICRCLQFSACQSLIGLYHHQTWCNLVYIPNARIFNLLLQSSISVKRALKFISTIHKCRVVN